MLTFRTDKDIPLAQLIDLYVASTLGARRPVDEPARIAKMLAAANLVITAWEGELLVGISRGLSDFAYVTYLSDLAVRESHQRRGIGVELIRRTREAAPMAKIVLLAAPAAEEYYPKVGFTRHESAWLLQPDEPIVG